MSNFSPYMFESITFGAFATVFIFKLMVVVALLALSLIGYKTEAYVKLLSILSLAAIFFGELMNSGARIPYFVVIGKEGIHYKYFANFYIEIPSAAVYTILAFLIVSILIFLLALFYAFFKQCLEVPE